MRTSLNQQHVPCYQGSLQGKQPFERLKVERTAFVSDTCEQIAATRNREFKIRVSGIISVEKLVVPCHIWAPFIRRSRMKSPPEKIA